MCITVLRITVPKNKRLGAFDDICNNIDEIFIHVRCMHCNMCCISYDDDDAVGPVVYDKYFSYT